MGLDMELLKIFVDLIAFQDILFKLYILHDRIFELRTNNKKIINCSSRLRSGKDLSGKLLMIY